MLPIDGVNVVPEQERARTRRWLADLLAAFFAVLVRRRHEAAGAGAGAGADADAAPGEALLSSVRTKPSLGRLATNPLMCALICALHRERRDHECELTGDLDEESQVELLQRLAFRWPRSRPLAAHPRLTLVNTMGTRLRNADGRPARLRLNPLSGPQP